MNNYHEGDQNYQARKKRIKWFEDARFGMFIHWGLYAIPARGEWVRSFEKMSVEDYQPFFEEFNPVHYNPKEWAKAAKAAGMKYVVMTTKHHDGFCLFDSQLTEYKATNTPAKRDLIKEYVEAFREEGLAVGFYYSLLDWYHEHYPTYGDRQHPMRENEAYKDKKYDFSKYVDYLHGQVRELLTNYGEIDIMWFDFSYEDMKGEMWRASELVQMIRSLQPDIIINNRLSAKEDFEESNPPLYTGDFGSPEQIIPPGGLVNKDGLSLPWEACITLNNHWGYCADDRDYKAPQQVIRGLVECVSKGGNLLLNVGPDAKGRIPKESLEILSEVGQWVQDNGQSIYGCMASELSKPEWGRYTQNGDMLYAHIYDRGFGPICLQKLKGKVAYARLLADGSELNIQTPWNAEEYPDDLFINLKGSKLPDEKDTVIALKLI